ncbi:hypothetical protein, partial [Desulfovibrio legallii]
AGENRNLKDFLPTRYSLVNEPPDLPAPPDLFGRREECLCSPSLPESTVFFASGKISFLPRVAQKSVFSSRVAGLCTPLPSLSTVFFASRKISFAVGRTVPVSSGERRM